MCASIVYQNSSFTSRVRHEFVQHGHEWARFYSPLFETLRQRGLTARLDTLTRGIRVTAHELLVCAAATTGIVTEWSLKLHTQQRWTAARYAISFIDDFIVGLVERLTVQRCNLADLGRYGSKVRFSRNALCRNLRDSCGRRPVQSQVFGGILNWIYSMHYATTSDMLLGKTISGRMPTELVDLVREKMNEIEDFDRDEAELVLDEYAREESRVLARAGVMRLGAGRRSTTMTSAA